MLAPPETQLPAGALGELFRRIGMELGAIPPPPGTQRIERRVSLPLRSGSINDVALRSMSFDRLKTELQGQLMRELHRLHYLLPRPIPSVGADGVSKAPVWAHARMRFAKPAHRDVENFRVLVSKALGDALTGPKWKGRGADRRPAHNILIYRGAAYEGRWLTDDTHRDWLLTMDFDEHLGPALLTVRLVWDEPLP